MRNIEQFQPVPDNSKFMTLTNDDTELTPPKPGPCANVGGRYARYGRTRPRFKIKGLSLIKWTFRCSRFFAKSIPLLLGSNLT